ncbi:MAG: FecR domain-containing protein, partial [Candidatus Nitrohelix vancouverensis]
MFAQSQPSNPLLPKNHKSLGAKELYEQTSQILSKRGVSVLKDKDPEAPMTDLEFVRLAYALTGESREKSLFEQKKFLKDKGVIASADIGLTTGLDGKANQSHQGDENEYSAKLAAPVFLNDKIKTHDKSNIAFTFDDKSTLELGKDAVVKISKHVYNPDKGIRQTVVNVASGMVRFIVTTNTNKGSNFKVVTPTATAGVLGTEFVVIVKPDGQTQFLGIESKIETANLLPDGSEGKKVIVAAGQMRTLDKSGFASEVSKVPTGMIQSLVAQTTTKNKITETKKVSRTQATTVAQNQALTEVASLNLNETASNTTGGAVATTTTTVSNTTTAVTDKVESTVTNTVDKVGETTDKLLKTADNLVGGVGETTDKLLKTADKLLGSVDGVTGKLTGTTDKLLGSVDGVTGKLTGTTDKLLGSVDGVTGKLTGTTDKLLGSADGVTGKLTGTTDKLLGSADGVTGKLTGTTDKLLGSVSGATGKLDQVTGKVGNVTAGLTGGLGAATGKTGNVTAGLTDSAALLGDTGNVTAGLTDSAALLGDTGNI